MSSSRNEQPISPDNGVIKKIVILAPDSVKSNGRAISSFHQHVTTAFKRYFVFRQGHNNNLPTEQKTDDLTTADNLKMMKPSLNPLGIDNSSSGPNSVPSSSSPSGDGTSTLVDSKDQTKLKGNRSKKRLRIRPSFRNLSAAVASVPPASDNTGDYSDDDEDGFYRQIPAAVVAVPQTIVAVPKVAHSARQNDFADCSIVRPRVQLALQRRQKWPDESWPTYCPICGSTIETTLRYSAGKFSVILSCILASTGVGLLGLFVLPYCCQYCLDVRHHCPVCNELLGIHIRRFPGSLRMFRCVL